MEDEKKKRLIVAGTVGAVFLALVLLSMMVYLLIAIGVENKRNKELKGLIAQYDVLIYESETSLETRSELQWVIRRARQLGYIFPEDREVD